MQRITLSIDILKTFLKIFQDYKENLLTYFEQKSPKPWSFHPSTVFERYHIFLERLDTIQVS